MKGKQSTLFAEDSPASLSVLPGSKEAKKMTVTSGLNISGLYKKSGPVGFFAKMLLASSTWASTKCFLTWKVKTTPSKHLIFQLVPSMPRIEETEFGLLPTPRVSDTEGGRVKNVEMINGKYSRTNKNGVRWGVKLRDVAEEPRLWPTPQAESTTTLQLGKPSLTMMAQMWPTPNASDNRDRGNLSDPAIQRRIALGKQVGLTMAVKDGKGIGTLNPVWVEWLMGFPTGWTDLNS